MSQKYVALSPIDHTGDKKIYPPGSVISLDHLAPEMVQRLVDGGHVRPVEGPEAEAEVKKAKK